MAITDAMVALYSTTLAATSSSLSISGIPTSGYRDLKIIVSCTGTMAGNGVQGLQFNGDTSANYADIGIYGESTSTGTEVHNSAGYIKASVSNVTPNEIFTFEILDYSAVDKFKNALIRTGNTATNVSFYAGRWNSTSAINSIRLYHTGTNVYGIGTTISLFGIKV